MFLWALMNLGFDQELNGWKYVYSKAASLDLVDGVGTMDTTWLKCVERRTCFMIRSL